MSTNTPPATPAPLTEAERMELGRAFYDAVEGEGDWNGAGVDHDWWANVAVKVAYDRLTAFDGSATERAVLATAAAIRQRKQPATPGELSAATMDALSADLAAIGELSDTEPATPVCDGCDGDGVVYHAECSIPGCDHEEPCPLCSGEPATPTAEDCDCPSLPCVHRPRGSELASEYMDEASAIVAARIARSHPFAPGTVLGHRQAWLREAIARAIEGKPVPAFVEPATPGGEVADAATGAEVLPCGECNGIGTVNTPSYVGVCHHCEGRKACRYQCKDCRIAGLRRALTASEEARKAAERERREMGERLVAACERMGKAEEIARIAADRDNAITADLDAADALVMELANALAREHPVHHPDEYACQTCLLLHRAREWAK